MTILTELVGKKHTFDDGDSIEVIQVKWRSEDPMDTLVTVHIQQGPGIPRKQVMQIDEFVNTYGHLFGVKTDDIEWPDSN